MGLEPRNIRDVATDRHRTVDDKPAGGGAGMVLRADIAAAALDAAASDQARGDWPVIDLSPRGRALRSGPGAGAGGGAGGDPALRAVRRCRRAGLAARAVEEVSLGDFVMTGGEIAAHGLDRRHGPAYRARPRECRLDG